MKKWTMTVAAAAMMVAGTAVAHADVTIAVVGPMTGDVASFGDQMKRGAEMAVKDLNAHGGVMGQKVKLLVGDDACDPKQAVSVANQMAQDKVAMVAGHFCSGSSIPASSVYNEENIIMISPASTNPTLTEQGFQNVFRTCGRDDQQGLVAGEYIAKHFPKARIAIVDDRQTYSKGLADNTRAALHKLGIHEVMDEQIVKGEKDYSALVSKLKANRVDVLYYGGYHPEAGLIVRQMRQQGMKTQMISGDALVTNEFWAITGPAGQGTMMTFSPDPRKRPENKALVERFRKSGYEPEAYTLYTYGTIQAWAQAATDAKSFDSNKVEAALHKYKFNTVLGKIGFDAKGDVTAPGYVMYVWKNGQYDYAPK